MKNNVQVQCIAEAVLTYFYTGHSHHVGPNFPYNRYSRAKVVRAYLAYLNSVRVTLYLFYT
jgi:hypothetical protein